ncbi:hypothetical protein CONPUDRAFT_131960 [Coniophora puteana RWD-64-598 SS2]|uniref:Uncharacterized protein n=1 Tax=Coniophora puteana (strain RWD-64-598) TaxID=741705 RepID=A0A5M3M9G5_CONPW|nr:uncharacterized protein CONPUDRAFT_131960 [Coniophora puteana RWD-64-598 SS2]EIW75743.1 hypothetical protein CONPUDRAFT_131960 [Coniophora puteana RWD-64-598 SS2]
MEELIVWKRDPVECVKELIGNPTFREMMQYAPEKVYEDMEGECRIYDEMWTGDWWWNLQKMLPPGATVAPVILASDKTQLTSFSGDKSAWPVYLSIGNIPGSIRRRPSSKTTVLIGYIPTTKLDIFRTDEERSRNGQQLFHHCMSLLLNPLVEAGKNGVDMVCADGKVRTVFPILSAYIADWPEQCLVACTKESRCPKCLAGTKERGEPVDTVLRDPEKTKKLLRRAGGNPRDKNLKEHGIRAVDPFWADLPHCNIFSCLTPDLLHQLHKGVFGDHVWKWSTEATAGGEEEIDRRFKSMPSHPSVRHFNKGISVLSQMTGTEYKNIEKVYLGALIGVVDLRVHRAVQAILDFIVLASFESHTDDSLTRIDSAWSSWHENKGIFRELGIRRQDFGSIPKLHMLRYYITSIRSRGAAAWTNTELSERYHIEYAKSGYRASNRRDFLEQMTVWLRRQEAIHRRRTYLDWLRKRHPDESAQAEDEGEADGGEEEEEGRESQEQQERSEFFVNTPALPTPVSHQVLMARTPAYPNASVRELGLQSGLNDFPPVLHSFLLDSGYSRSITSLDFSHLRVQGFKRFTIRLPSPFDSGGLGLSEVNNDSIRATFCQAPRTPLRSPSPARFDTALAIQDPSSWRVSTSRSDGSLSGLKVCRVRFIFKLQPEGQPLAYVEWFNAPLWSSDLGLFSVSKAYRRRPQRQTSIIPTSSILCSCHLIPKFGTNIGPKPDADDALDTYTTFYLNPYLRAHDYLLLRYHKLYDI